MLIGVPKEIKANEYRVGLTPSSVREAIAHGHRVLVERGAGEGISVSDSEYAAVGATLASGADVVFADAELIVKVKEPQPAERRKLRRGQVLLTFLHLAPDPAQANDLLASGCIA
ncbi:MAG: alanine dehydrogenase, partial [Burkholderiales bacterium]